ncbi:MAG: hypothetical protein AB1652_11070, partial [Bacillota bacterium]
PPSREACPECGGLMVVKGRRDGVGRLQCINENCGFQLEKEAGDNGEAKEPLPADGHHPGETIQPNIGIRG